MNLSKDWLLDDERYDNVNDNGDNIVLKIRTCCEIISKNMSQRDTVSLYMART